MRNIDACYICSTPFQIIAAISIAQKYYETADIYILNHFEGADICASRIKDYKIFAHIHFFDDRRYIPNGPLKILRWLKIVINYLQCKVIARKMIIPDTRYRKLYISCRDIIPRIIWLYFVKCKLGVELIYFDDGAGSYFNDELMKFKSMDRILSHLIAGNAVFTTAQYQLLFSPSLYRLLNGNSPRTICAITANFTRTETVSMFNNIFQLKISDLIAERFILLDCMHEELFDINEQKKLLNIYREIFNICMIANIIVKQHPRDASNKIDNVKYYKNHQIPFECICMNMDCNNKVLISVSSTAVCTPKLLLGDEPYVILLYRLVKSKHTSFADEERYYYACKSLYCNPERFMIPKTIEELINNLRKIS